MTNEQPANGPTGNPISGPTHGDHDTDPEANPSDPRSPLYPGNPSPAPAPSPAPTPSPGTPGPSPEGPTPEPGPNPTNPDPTNVNANTDTDTDVDVSNGPEQSNPTPEPKASRMAGYSATDPYWDSDEALEAMKMERAMRPEETDAELAQRIFKEAAPQAATGIVHLAFHGVNENTRLNAQKYVVERVLGKIGDTGDSEDSPLNQMVKELAAAAERHANGG